MESGLQGDEHSRRRDFFGDAMTANEKKITQSRKKSLTIFHKFVTQHLHCER